MGATRDDFIKYPRTPHLFGSKGTDDDKHLGREESEAFIVLSLLRSPFLFLDDRASLVSLLSAIGHGVNVVENLCLAHFDHLTAVQRRNFFGFVFQEALNPIAIPRRDLDPHVLVSSV